jgi:hypothetical protein
MVEQAEVCFKGQKTQKYEVKPSDILTSQGKL